VTRFEEVSLANDNFKKKIDAYLSTINEFLIKQKDLKSDL